MNALKFNKQVIYRFKQRYGQPAYVYEIESHNRNAETGDKTTVLSVRFIPKCCVLTQSEARRFVYDLAYISANKDFTTGGFFDPQDRQVFFDLSDLNGYMPKVGDFLYVNQKQYMLKDVDDTLGFIVRGTARRISGCPIVHAASAHSALLVDCAVDSALSDKLTRSVNSVLTLTDAVVENP